MSSDIKDVVDKISSYNIFTTLLPGALFAGIADRITEHRFVQSDILTALALYYFLGMILSRIGALIVKPLITRLGLVAFKPYSEYLAASKQDPMIANLVEAGNMYRTMIALALSLGLLIVYDRVRQEFLPPAWTHAPAIAMGIGLLFTAAYVRNSRFIGRRIEHAAPTPSRP
jgi:hypothetical protein